MTTPQNTIVLGTGIIGLSTAHYLAQHQPPATIHLVEASPDLFASASGLAAGFLARDWFSPAVAALGALSFDEHRRLAEAHDGAARWGYRRSVAVSYTRGEGCVRKRKEKGGTGDWLRTGASRATAATRHRDGKEEDDDDDEMTPAWLRRTEGDVLEIIAGDSDTTAQIDPLRLCHFLLGECRAQGVQLHHPAKAIAVLADLRGELSSVTIAETTSSTETDVPCTRLVIAAGAWSPRVFAELFPASRTEVPISSLAGHSLVVRSPLWTEGEGKTRVCHAVYETSNERGHSSEIFSRAGGEIWVGGLNSAKIPLPERASEREIQGKAISALRSDAEAFLGSMESSEEGGGELEIVRESLCFRPVTPFGMPIISRVDDGLLGGELTTRSGVEGGVFLAAGHGPWGISLSLGTGKVLAEMIQGRRLSADLGSLPRVE